MLSRLLLLAQGAIHQHQHQQARALQHLLHGIPPSRALEHANPSLATTAPVSAAAASQQPSMASPSADCKQSSGEQLPAHHVKQRGVNPWAARFQNIWEGYNDNSLSNVRKWKRERPQGPDYSGGHLIGKPKPTAEDFKAAFPLNPVDGKALAAPDADPTALQMVWIGHATMLVQMAGLTFLTDPVFSERCSPVQFLGPKRVVAPALSPEDPELPDKLDFVLLSHNHYDHLDAGSVHRLNKRYGSKLLWYVPLGVGEWFHSEGIRGNVIELDWWQSVKHRDTDVNIIMTPAQHWSNRFLHDKYYTLWGGFVVQSPKLKFWFAGDTGYCSVFKEIGQRLGPFDVSAIPIGAYEPRWFMRPQHVDTSEALLIHRDVGSKLSVSIHCCTFALTDEPLDEPPKKLAEELASTPGANPKEFITLQHGSLLQVKGNLIVNSPKLLPVS